MTTIDPRLMTRALELARRGLYTASPNPRVGCVCVADSQIIGEGWHQTSGEPHAEIHALRQAGDRAKGSVVYVTLEPCSHYGSTPPCADALIAAQVAEVVIAGEDPNPKVAGRGIRKLRAAGIHVSSGILEPEAQALNPGFFKRMRQGLPWVRIKMAASMDGKTAMASGESQWISGPESRSDVHYWRARSDAILSGIGTLLADDPSLNTRIEGDVKQATRVIVDSQFRTPLTAMIFSIDGPIVIAGRKSSGLPPFKPSDQLDYLSIADHRDGVDLHQLLKKLAKDGLNEVQVEAGANLTGSLIQANLFDEILLYQAPILLGSNARNLFTLAGIESMAERIELKIHAIAQLGNDVRIRLTHTNQSLCLPESLHVSAK